VRLASQLFAQKGYRATTVREIADAAGILSGSLYHHFESKESIGDEILTSFLDDIRVDYRAAVSSGGDPRSVLEQIVRNSSQTLAKHRAALSMLQNDWSYFNSHPRFGYLRKALREFEQTLIRQMDTGRLAPLGRLHDRPGGGRVSSFAVRRDHGGRPLAADAWARLGTCRTTSGCPRDRPPRSRATRSRSRAAP